MSSLPDETHWVTEGYYFREKYISFATGVGIATHYDLWFVAETKKEAHKKVLAYGGNTDDLVFLSADKE